MISHTHRALYVHIPKTGGQSVEQVFLDDLGLVRPCAPLLLMANPGGAGPVRLAHLTLAEYVRHRFIRPEQYGEYFRFSVVRNPWNRVISFYHYMPYYVDFRTFVVDVLFGHLWSTRYHFVAPQSVYLDPPAGLPGVDLVLRLEHLSDEFETVRERLDLNAPLPWVNRSAATPAKTHLRRRTRVLQEAIYRRDAGLARFAIGHKQHHDRRSDYFDDRTAGLVADRYASDIEQFGYTFDELDTPA